MLDTLERSCPYCGEHILTTVDRSGGSAQYVEDCPVCCQPIQFDLRLSFAGELEELTLSREDD